MEENNESQAEKDIKEQFETDLKEFVVRYGLERVKVESRHFTRDYRNDADGFYLKQEKAIIRSYGQTRVIPIGEGTPYQTFEEAEEALRERMSEYHRKRREEKAAAGYTEEEREKSRLRQRRYQARQRVKRVETRAHERDFKRQQ